MAGRVGKQAEAVTTDIERRVLKNGKRLVGGCESEFGQGTWIVELVLEFVGGEIIAIEGVDAP